MSASSRVNSWSERWYERSQSERWFEVTEQGPRPHTCDRKCESNEAVRAFEKALKSIEKALKPIEKALKKQEKH